jgi:hypothetical protein
VRDRLLAVGMRRPDRLHETQAGRRAVSEVDFRMEAQTMDMFAFVWLCKLSEIMADIAIFQRDNKFSRDWNANDSCVGLSEAEKVIGLEQELRSWRGHFEMAALKVVSGDRFHNIQVPHSNLRILNQSVYRLY